MDVLEAGAYSQQSAPAASLECDLLRRLAARTWGEIRNGEEVGIRVGEESITDRLLLDLSLAFPLTKVIKWNRLQEGRTTGADWDWWFFDPAAGAGVGLRIQAKRVDYFNEEFNGLAASNQWGDQRTMLQSSAAAAGLHPLYCFYLASRVPRAGRTLCGSHESGESPPGWPGPPEEIYGCSLVGPATVETAISTRDSSLNFFWRFLLPWACLFCCEGLRGSPMERVDFHARRLRARSAERGDSAPESLVTENLPPEVWAVLEREQTFAELAPPDVGATVITLLRSGGEEPDRAQ
jgi:hypothetical protein